MSTRSQSVLGRYGRTIVLIVLTPITTLNASQALTLCVGYNGRVTLELLVQDRCTCEIRTSGTGTPGAAMAGSARVTDRSSLPCLDIPVPGGACDNRMTAGPASNQRRQRQIALSGLRGPLGQVLALAVPTVAQPRGPDNGSQSLLASVSYYSPLDSVLLRV